MKTIMINSNLNTVEPEKNELEDIPAEIMDKHIFVELRKCGWREMPWNRYVVLSFDIISCKSLNPQLSAKHVDDLPSFVVFFGIQIINTKRFQPIGKVFCRLSTSPVVVAVCVKSFIRDLMRCEYFVVASVCRTMSFLQQVVHHLVGIDTLISKTDAHVYKVEFLKIVHLYDPVVMLEHTFLSFLKYAFKYRLDNKDCVASYEDCKKIMIASTSEEIISDVFDHTNNIVCAMRLFSMTFYREIKNCISKGQLYDTGTAEFCALMDKMFDTLHGDTDEFTVKLNRYALTKTSTHFIIWERCLKMLSTMRACSNPVGRVAKNENSKKPKDKITDNYDCCDMFKCINQMEIAIDTEEMKTKLQKRVVELETEYEEIDVVMANENEEDMENIQIKDLEENNEIHSDEEANIQNIADNEYYVEMYEVEKIEDADEIVPDYKICRTVDSTVDIFGDYSKKLFLILKESECADLEKYDDYAACKFDENGECVALDDYNKTECTVSDDYLKYSVENSTTVRHSDQEEDVETDYLISNDYCKKSTSSSILVSGMFIAFDYIHECLESCRPFEEATNKIIIYLEKFNAFDLNPDLQTSEITEQVHAIHECLLKMFSMLSANDPNVNERQKAYGKLTNIKKHLQNVLSTHKEIEEAKNTDQIHSIPQFFDKVTYSGKENITHIALNKLHQEMERIYPEVRHFYNKIENLSNEESNSANNNSSEKEEMEKSSVAQNDFRPFVLDAWQITINGAKMLFEFLEKKRIKQLDMSSLNIDHIRQIFNAIKIDNGIHIENKYQIKVLFINAAIVSEVFETDGALILE